MSGGHAPATSSSSFYLTDDGVHRQSLPSTALVPVVAGVHRR
jgi:hypothetical protein